jgi:hypothetical protein
MQWKWAQFNPVSHLTSSHIAGFEVLSAVVMKCSIFWDITPWSPLKVNRLFRGRFRVPASRWFLAWLILRPWRWSRHVPPKYRLTWWDNAVLYSIRYNFLLTHCLSIYFCASYMIPSPISIFQIKNLNIFCFISHNYPVNIVCSCYSVVKYLSLASNHRLQISQHTVSYTLLNPSSVWITQWTRANLCHWNEMSVVFGWDNFALLRLQAALCERYQKDICTND